MTRRRATRPRGKGLRAAAATALAVLAVAASGCGDRPDPAAELMIPEQPVAGGELVLAVQDDAASLDPHTVTDAASMRRILRAHGYL